MSNSDGGDEAVHSREQELTPRSSGLHKPEGCEIQPGTQWCTDISRLNSLGPGSIWLGCNFRCTELIKYTEAFTVLPGTHLLLGWESAHVGKVPCLGAQYWRRDLIQPTWGLSSQSLACTSCTLPLSHDAPNSAQPEIEPVISHLYVVTLPLSHDAPQA